MTDCTFEKNLQDKIDSSLRSKLLLRKTKNFTGQCNIRIDKDVHKKLVHKSILSGCSLNMLISTHLELLVSDMDDIND